ncbi:hypothetical protein ACRE_020850 [Hapsidospora chrysogenum ATCC 11550]|uniref:Uncharacterized protein n=1 Tax=Hapsidospora chrysogenum (strain ATCC 11550 / CBS 779.69 / DSM 880 / IAM 14645 / JCM 23072 / IMI 49137) TaxID=857340 RepID=A0A086TCA4_HAPC1|nr:hypothetical protein ACRE_020850 [Hapsidospora chrysogenum ATCC 11550]
MAEPVVQPEAYPHIPSSSHRSPHSPSARPSVGTSFVCEYASGSSPPTGTARHKAASPIVNTPT